VKFSLYIDDEAKAKGVSSEKVRGILAKDQVGSSLSKELISYAIHRNVCKRMIDFPGSGSHVVEVHRDPTKTEEVQS